MKCRSVACIWSDTPPLQKVTATAVLNTPATLYTGGSDGSIIWWNLSSMDSNPDIKPVAMLCGHAACITDLGICYPVDFSRDGKTESSSNVVMNSNADNNGALISACADGMLCIWSRSSGHCRRRRKLPPWVGSPSIIRRLPSNPRYVCIACCFNDPVHLPNRHCVASGEEGEAHLDRDSLYRKTPKCTVVIVDTYTLTISRTIFHGNLAIGPLKFMEVISSSEVMDNQSALIADAFGRLLLLPMLKDSHPNGDGGKGLHQSSQLQMNICADGLGEGEHVMAYAPHGNIIAVILKNRCIFRLVASGATIGEICFADNLHSEGDSAKLHVTGGMFLESLDAGSKLKTQELHEELVENFAVWDNQGSAIVYLVSYLEKIFECEPICQIPAAFHPADARSSISFVQLNCYLLRVESVCFNFLKALQWEPRVTIWSMRQTHEEPTKLYRQCKMLGESNFFLNWSADSSMLKELDGQSGSETKLTSQESSVSSSKYVKYVQSDDENHGFAPKECIVSSSMVISENFYTPYAIVYGFFSGEIEVVQFDSWSPDSHGTLPHPKVDSHVSRQKFSGHTSAVLCLAVHQIVGATQGWSFNHILLSGSMDCTVCIWDLGSGNLITVMHQHVAPVRQIILPPAQIDPPWNDCFLTVGEDSCVALASLQTLRVERMFPGHPSYPAKVLWDGIRGYIACLCQKPSGASDVIDVLYIWDIKTGARERVLRGTPSHSMYDFFCRNINMNSHTGMLVNGNTSVSSLILPTTEDATAQSHFNNSDKQETLNMGHILPKVTETSSFKVSRESSAKMSSVTPPFLQNNRHTINCSSPLPGIVTLNFDLTSLMFLHQESKHMGSGDKQESTHSNDQGNEAQSPVSMPTSDGLDMHGSSLDSTREHDWVRSLEECILRFSLSFLHSWNVDYELDQLLVTDMKLKKPENFIVAPGLQGDKGSLTLAFPGMFPSLELWKSSSEFSAMRSLTMVSLAQRMISLSHSSSEASRALAAFYTRNFAEKIPYIKPPLLQLLVSFWQDESEHVRMAARSLFHCAASRAIPLPLCGKQETDHAKFMNITPKYEENGEVSSIEGTSTNKMVSDPVPETPGIPQLEESKIIAWLESYEMQDWISCVGGTSQDAMTSHIIVAAALAIWYPSLVKPSLAMLVVHPLMKLVMAMNEKYSSTAAELLAEGMDNTWKACIGPEIPHLIGDILFQIECVSGASADSLVKHPAVPVTMQETLVGVLLPSLAMADIPGFLTVVESQIWSTASDSPVHIVSLKTLIRVVRGSPRNLAQYLDKAVDFIFQTIDPSNSVMRRTCLQSSMQALKEIVRVFPMVALNDTSTRLAVGDAVKEINNASIRVYDMQSVTKIKILDASGPLGLPSLLAGSSESMVTTAISALSFSPDGEGLVAFSGLGLMIRWWSLGSVWWEKLSRNYVPVQCTKLIFVPPWEGFSPNSIRSSILGHDGQIKTPESSRSVGDMDSLKLLIHNLDLSYRLEWVADRKILLTSHGHELGTFLL